ncbi:MAG: maltotransferase domain-containing protein, partial [Bacteroidota bacterium]
MTTVMTVMSEEPRIGGGARPAGLAVSLKSRSIVIQNVQPQIDDGRWAVKREVGDDFEVTAEIFRDGHVKLAAVILWRRADETTWREMPMTLINPGLDRWSGSIRLTANTTYRYSVEAWSDVYETWADELEKKIAGGQKVNLELTEGRALVAEAVDRAQGDDAEMLTALLASFDKADDDGRRERLMLAEHVRAAMARWPDRETAIRYDRELEVFVDRVEARFAAWYEMFHRSQGKVPGKSATFADCEERLPEIKAMGFDVVYFVPIHPIGRVHRKGPNNTLGAGPKDPGSPYAIGSAEGGHKA